MVKPVNRMITGSGSTGSGLVPTAEDRMITGSGSTGSGLVPTPVNRMITGSGSSGSGRVPTPVNRMITGSGSSGSGLVPAPANRMITVSRSSFRGHLPTTIGQFWQMTRNPLSSDPQGKLYEKVGRLFEDHIQDVRKMDIFDAIRKKIRHLEEIPSAFYKQIWGNKEAIAKVPVMTELVREFIDIMLDTSSLYIGLATRLVKEETEHDKLEKALRKVPLGSPPLDKALPNEVKKKLRDFMKNACRDPFEDLQQQFKSLLERYEGLRKKLEKKNKELSRKRKASRVWRIVSASLMVALTAAAAITSVVAVVVAPPTATVVMGTAASIYATSMASLREMMLSFRREGKAEKMAEKVLRHSVGTELDLKGIKNSMAGLNVFRAPIVDYVNEYLKDHSALNLVDIAMPIVKKEEELLPKLGDLVKKVGGCRTNLTVQIEDLKKHFF